MRRPRLAHPAADEPWRVNLRNSALRVGFQIGLSKAMLEFLSATADDVQWDRGLYWHCSTAAPDNFIASGRSLEKRGLIQRIDPEKMPSYKMDHAPGEFCCYKLTPAGKLVVELLKMAGVFMKADAAINRESRKRRA